MMKRTFSGDRALRWHHTGFVRCAVASRHARTRPLRHRFESCMPVPLPRLSIETSPAALVATQVWHHAFIDGSPADLPTPVTHKV
jgi:hypothetical protein